MKNIKHIVAAGFTAVALMQGSALAQGNLLLNGDFNTGDLTGWWTYAADGTQSGSVVASPAFDTTPNLMMVSGSSTWREATGQTGVAIGAGVQYQLSFVYNSSVASPSFAVSINYYDSSNTYLNYEWVPTVIDTAGAWTTYTGTFTTPVNTANLSVEFDLYSPATVQIDNVSLQPAAVPEPTTISLICLSGLCGVVMIATRRRKA